VGAEIQNLERTLAGPGVTGAERRGALIRLARLRQLSGDIEAAAKNWLEAAAAAPDQPDDSALVAGVYCLAAMGEWDQAAAALRPLLQSGRQGPALLQGRYLDACVTAWNAADASALLALAADPEFAALRPSVYYTLWKTLAANPGLSAAGGSDNGAAAAAWKERLLAEFPQSPEGRIAAAEAADAASTVSVAPSPLWLLLPGRGGFDITAPVAPAPAAAVPGGASAGKVLQTGLYNHEANARAQAVQLTKAGFSPAISRKTVNGKEYWAVTVPPGADINRTIKELKDAGFNSFPVE
jgi:hypothetical protein